MRRRRRACLAAACLVVLPAPAEDTTARADDGYFGVAQVSINPTTPVLLSGYAGRVGEATQVQQTIRAQAAAFGTGDATSLMLAVDACGLPADVVESVAGAITASHGIPRERINICCTHSHSCPHVQGYAPNVVNPTAAESQHISLYTQQLVARLTQAATDALDDRAPGHSISWGSGTVGFGQNRRGQLIAPNDHDLPVMRVTDASGAVKAIITSYATHATTLNAGDNVVSGDWPGYAREKIEQLYPGSVALVMIGAGADSDPNPRQGGSSVSYARNHGQAIANEVQRLITQNLLKPASFDIAAAHTEIDLPLATQRLPGDPGSARLAASPSSLSYGVTSWMFGDDLAMTFFEGELVVDYSLRLKSTYDDGRLWVNGYSNEVQAYIPSERILYEGGYEADDSSFWYALPGRFAHGIEDKIISAVQAQLEPFYNPTDRLRLRVNVATGQVEIVNTTDAGMAFDAYTVAADGNRFNAADGVWQSLQDQGVGGWEEADHAGGARLTEFQPQGATTLAAGASFALGHPLIPTPPTEFGQPLATGALEFVYAVPGNGTKTGIVEYVGDRNNLVLTIDPISGDAAIQNQSRYFDVAIDAYTISSATGALQPDAGQWQSLQDQSEGAWDEADAVTEFRVTEFNPEGATQLGRLGRVLLLGSLVDVSGAPLIVEDFRFVFSTASGRVIEGIVELGALPVESVAGDFDANGVVDGADFLEWQRTLGQAAVPAGSRADGDGNGIVDAGDLSLWRGKFGVGGVDAVTGNWAVPEPSAMTLAAFLLLGGVVPRPSRPLNASKIPLTADRRPERTSGSIDS